MDIKLLSGLAGVCVLAASACASTPEPTDRLVAAQSAMRAAKEVGISGVPQAQLHAQLAQEQLDKAEHLIKDGDNERAERLLLRATADAELALALSRQASAQQAADQAEAQIRGGGAQ
jgi:hypothetical protein